MADAEYQRLWRERQKLIKAGLVDTKPKPKVSHAEYMRNYRRMKKPPQTPKELSDEAVERAILRRGRELTEMMRTPACMWREEWFHTEDDN